MTNDKTLIQKICEQLEMLINNLTKQPQNSTNYNVNTKTTIFYPQLQPNTNELFKLLYDIKIPSFSTLKQEVIDLETENKLENLIECLEVYMNKLNNDITHKLCSILTQLLNELDSIRYENDPGNYTNSEIIAYCCMLKLYHFKNNCSNLSINNPSEINAYLTEITRNKLATNIYIQYLFTTNTVNLQIIENKIKCVADIPTTQSLLMNVLISLNMNNLNNYQQYLWIIHLNSNIHPILKDNFQGIHANTLNVMGYGPNNEDVNITTSNNNDLNQIVDLNPEQIYNSFNKSKHLFEQFIRLSYLLQEFTNMKELIQKTNESYFVIKYFQLNCIIIYSLNYHIFKTQQFKQFIDTYIDNNNNNNSFISGSLINVKQFKILFEKLFINQITNLFIVSKLKTIIRHLDNTKYVYIFEWYIIIVLIIVIFNSYLLTTNAVTIN